MKSAVESKQATAGWAVIDCIVKSDVLSKTENTVSCTVLYCDIFTSEHKIYYSWLCGSVLHLLQI